MPANRTAFPVVGQITDEVAANTLGQGNPKSWGWDDDTDDDENDEEGG